MAAPCRRVRWWRSTCRALRAAPEQLNPTLVYAPGARKAFAEASVTQNCLLVTELDNVKGRVYVYAPEQAGGWSHRAARPARQRHDRASSTPTCTAIAPS